MLLRNGIFWLLTLVSINLFTNCTNKSKHAQKVDTIDSLLLLESENSINSVTRIKKRSKNPDMDSIVGDTVWVNPYVVNSWYDTLILSDYSAYFSVWVDTLDYIIDTVKSTKGDRIVIGFNHNYKIEIIKGGKHWLDISLNKRKDLAQLLDGTDSWLESNLDVFENIHYNQKYNQFIIEFDINSRSNFGSLYYIIYNVKDGSNYIGTANSWGGEGPDGEPFLTENGELFVTCFEIYNFKNGSSMTLAQYVSLAEGRSYNEISSELVQIHGLRNLSHNNFLTVFNRFHGEPVNNAFILSTDTMILNRFSYYGIIEEMDAILLYTDDKKYDRSFLYDTDREKLICISKSEKPKVREMSISAMNEYTDDSCTASEYTLLDFDLYGTYEFLISAQDTAVYYRSDSYE